MTKEKEIDFQNLIAKFFTKEISDEEILLLSEWLNSDKKNRKIFDENNELWQESNTLQKLEHFKTDPAWVKISFKLELGRHKKSSVKVIPKYNFWLLIAAASVAVLLAIGGFGLYFRQNSLIRLNDSTQPFSTVVTTNDGEKSHVYLSDGTTVYLNSNSTVRIEGNYNEKDRSLTLTGEAYFNVKSNPEKPFIVNSGQVTVVATGTAFNVQAYENENRIETTLEEGEISVVIKDAEPLNIVAGKQVVYYRDSEKTMVRDAAPNTYTSWKENKLRFYNTPFMEVMRGISRRYNVKIEITDPTLLELTYNATFIDESIEEVMKYLKGVSPINYKIYYQTTVNDKVYTKPKIVIGSKK